MRRFGICGLMVGLAALLSVVLGSGVGSAVARGTTVTCPLKSTFPSGGDVQWAFSDSAPPSGHVVRNSYFHGQGNWTSGRSTGTVCATDSLVHGGAKRNLLISAAGPSKISGRVYQSGLLGVRMVLPLKVRASDDQGCPAGTTGTVTLFASYYSVHRDTAQVRYGSACRGHNLSYSGSGLHVYIARHGAQVNTP